MGRHSKKDPYTKKIEESQKKRRKAEKRAKEINKEWGFLDPFAPSTPHKNTKRYSYSNKTRYSHSSDITKLVYGEVSIWDKDSNWLAGFLLFIFVTIITLIIFVSGFKYENFYIIIPVSAATAIISVILYGKVLKKAQVNELKKIENENLSIDNEDKSDKDTCGKNDDNVD